MSLIKIGESIHCTLPALRGSVLRLLSNDPLAQYAGERHIAQTIRTQVDAGADFLDVNVDELAAGGFTFEQTADAMRRLLALILKHGDGVPPGIDSADPRLLEVGLRYWYQAKGGSVAGAGNGVPARRRPPILNSVAASRLELLALRREFPFSVIAMLLEKVSADGTPFEVGFSEAAPAESYWHTARFLFQKCRAAGFTASEVFFDPTVGPLGADYVGYTKQTFGGIKLIKSDPELADSHVVLGLSNCADGLPHRGSINRAYLRVAMEHGADAAICDVTRVTGQDKVSPASLRLVKQVISPKGGDPATALEHLADYCAAQSRPTPARPVPAVRNTLAEALGTPGRVVYLAEMVPSEGQLDQLFRFAEQARRHPDVVLSLTDSAGGVRTPQPDPLAVEVARLMDRQPLVNVSCKSEDRDGLLNR
ncbi:MAG: dihydropteroate synthase, partial [Chloroflexi bacterium]|nr:dihydropteroate synthase [Chloroflexota bacterium]